MATVEPRTRSWTRDEYLWMAEAGLFRDQRVQLVEGEVIEVSPQSSRHATAIRLLALALAKVFGPGYEIREQLPLDLGGRSQPEPDLAVVRGSPRDYAHGHPTTALLVVEVADASLADVPSGARDDLDRREKASLYAAHGIPEYWVVDLAAGRVEVHRSPTPDAELPSGHGYRDVRPLGRGEELRPAAAPAGTAVPVDEVLP